MESAISAYITQEVEISPDVKFSQYKLINRIYKFRNRDLTKGDKLNADLSYDYYFDIISPRADSEIKNLRFDSKHIMVFSQNPRKDFAAVFLCNASLKNWMSENGEDEKLKAAVEEFVANGNIGFKRVDGGYERIDPLNTYPTNISAESVDDTDLIERHEMTASQIKRMTAWEQNKVDLVIRDMGNKSFKTSENGIQIESTNKRYELFEFTGEVNEEEFNALQNKPGGDKHKYFLAKAIVAGLNSNKTGEKITLFAEKLDGKMSDYYIYAHRGRYEGRFWRVGTYEMLFDHQIRANEIGNDIARALGWSSKIVFQTSDSSIMQNIRADMDNGDVIVAKDLKQVEVRAQGVDQLIADWNRLMNDADRLTNSLEVVRGEGMPSGTPFRMGLLMNENAGKLFTLLRQKITLPYKRVFREWVLPELIKDMKGKKLFRFTGETDILDQLREIMVESWYIQNLVKIGPHTKEVAEAIKQEKLDELRKKDPIIQNTKEIWKSVQPRLLITITGENSDIQDQMQDLLQFIQLEKDPVRIEWILDMMYRARNIPIPPKKKEEPPDPMMTNPTQTQPEDQQKPQLETADTEDAQQPVIQ